MRKLQLRLQLLSLALVLPLLTLTPWANTSVQAATPKTTVSLTFDDALASQTIAQSLLDQHGMKGTFYLISGDLGTSGHLSVAQAQALQSDNQDIGGHTITHPDLPTLSSAQQQHEICDGREQLYAYGLYPATFAYPFGDYNTTSEQIAQQCGFSSARAVGGIDCASNCDTAETIPPADSYAVQTPDSIKSSTSLATMESYVSKAEKNGGWVVLVMHDICTSSSCSTYSVSKTKLNSFLTWLQGQAVNGVGVRTMRQVMGSGTTPPTPPPAPTTLVNPSLETDSYGGAMPDCWQEGGFGTNTASWTRTNDAHSGNRAVQMQLSSYTNGDAKLVSAQHDPSCDPTATPGTAYTVSTWYKSNQPVYLVAYYLDATGTWQFWNNSAAFAPNTTYTQATWTTPAFPSGATHISVGLSLRRVGSVTMDDFGMVPYTPPTTLQNPSLETDTSSTSIPDCWQEGGFGTNTANWIRTSDAHTGNWAETLQVTSYTNGDAKLVSAQHTANCEPLAASGHTYNVSTWYKSNQPIYLVAYYLDATGTWQFWDESNSWNPSSTYTQATWTTPAFPSGATRISIGVSLRAVGSVTMDDFGLTQN